MPSVEICIQHIKCEYTSGFNHANLVVKANKAHREKTYLLSCADLNLRWEHRSECTLSHVAVQFATWTVPISTRNTWKYCMTLIRERVSNTSVHLLETGGNEPSQTTHHTCINFIILLKIIRRKEPELAATSEDVPSDMCVERRFRSACAIAYSEQTESSRILKSQSRKVELQWLEHLWDHENLFEKWVVWATEG